MTKLTRAELQRVNKQLEASGVRICSSCWRPLALTDYGHNGRYLRGQCKDCFGARNREAQRRAYRRNPAAAKAEWQEYKAAHLENVRQMWRDYYQRTGRRRRAARRLARLLETA